MSNKNNGRGKSYKNEKLRKREKNTIKNNSKSTDIKINSIFKNCIFCALLLLVFYPPFLRGLFFEEEQFITEIITLVIFAVFMIYKIIIKDKTFFVTPISYSLFGLVVVYFISCFFAVSTRASISEWLKYVMYFCVFFMLSEFLKESKKQITLVVIITLSALGVSIISIDSVIAGEGQYGPVVNLLNNIFNKLGAKTNVFFDIFIQQRIYSTFQYPGACASFIIAVFFILLGMLHNDNLKKLKIFFVSMGTLFFIVFWFTLSRSALILVPVFIMLFILLVQGIRNKIRIALNSIIMVFPLLVFYSKFDAVITGSTQNRWQFWIYIIIGMILSIILFVIFEKLFKNKKLNHKLDDLKYKIQMHKGLLVVIPAIAIMVFIIVLGAIKVVNSNKPLTIEHKVGEEDGVKSIKRTFELKPGSRYCLEYVVDAKNTGNKPYAYLITVASRNFEEVIKERDRIINEFIGYTTDGFEIRNIEFDVPSDSLVTIIYFMNNFESTSATFREAKLKRVDSYEKEQNIILANSYLTESLIERFQDFTVTKSNLERRVFYNDGIKMFQDYPLFGAGGGAWAKLNFKYQEYLYWSTQTHSFPVQIMVETGIIGIVVFVYLILSIILMYYRARRIILSNEKSQLIIFTAVFCAIGIMLMHSVLDFDLSLSAVSLLLWELFAIFNSMYNNEVDENLDYRNVERLIKIKKINLYPIIPIIVVIIIILIPISLNTAMNCAKAATEAYKNGNLENAFNLMKISVSYDPFKEEYIIGYNENPKEMNDIGLLDLKNYLIKNGVKKSELDNIAPDNLTEKVRRLSSYNADTLVKLAIHYLGYGKIEGALSLLERATELKPLVPNIWHRRFEANAALSRKYMQENKFEEAKKYANKVISAYEQMLAINGRSKIASKILPSSMDIIEKMRIFIDNKEKEIANNIDKLIFYSFPDIDSDLNHVPDQWDNNDLRYIIIQEKDGNVQVLNNTESETIISTRTLKFKPDKVYRCELEFQNKYPDKTLKFGMDGNFEEGMEFVKKGDKFIKEIVMPKELKKSEIKLDLKLSGKENLIKRFVIYETE